jgi:RNA recognition motif-containing protein
MSGPRLDVLKVFLGNLKRTVIKPEVCDMLEQNGLTPVDVIVPQGKGIAFAVFPDPEQTTRAVEIMHGVRHSCATAAVSAHRGANMGVFSNC